MGRKKKTAPPAGTTLHIVGNSGATVDDDDQEEIDEIDRLEDGELSRAMEEVAKVTGAVVEVVKLEDDRQKWCRNYPVARFSNEQIASDFGAGTYRIRFKGPNKSYLKGGSTIDIAAPLGGGVASAPPPSGISDVLAIIKAEKDKQSAQWMEWAKLLAPLALPKLIEVFGGGQKGPSLTELMQLIVSAKDFHKAPAVPTMEQQLEQFSRLLEVAKSIGGNDSNGATWPDLIKESIQQLPAVISGIRNGGIPMTGPILPAPALSPPGSVPVPALPLSATASIPPSASSAVGSGDMDLRTLPWLKATLESLLVQAANDRDPDMYAQVTLDNLPNYVTPEWLLKTLGRPDWWEMLTAADARVAVYVGWFRAYHEMLLHLLHESAVGAPPAPTDPSPPAAEPEFH